MVRPSPVSPLVLALSYSLLAANVFKDWLLSYYHPRYPLVASAATSAALVAGLIAMRHVRSLARWRDAMIAIATFLTLANLLHLLPRNLGIMPAVPALAAGLAIPPLLAPSLLPRRRAALYAAAAALGLATLVWPTTITHAMAVAAMVLAPALGVLGLQRARGIPLALAAAVAPLVIFVVIMLPLRTVQVTDTALLGLGLGWGKDSSAALEYADLIGAPAAPPAVPATDAMPFALVLAREQGLLGVLALGLVLLATLAGGAIVLTDARALDVRRQLAAGAIATLCGMLLWGQSQGSPFLTSDSVAGTWALVAAIASLVIAAAPRPVAEASSLRAGRLAAGLTIVAVAGLALALIYERTLAARILPFAGTAAPPGYAEYVTLDAISSPMQEVTVAFEDPNFRTHPGIDWRLTHEMLRLNLRAGRVVGGASTITQQLAKNLFLSPERTLGRKLREAALALAMERVLSKDRILELYLNTINYGMGQRGIAAAARYYFGETPAALTLAESALLVGLVPRPPRDRLDLHEVTVGQRIALVRIYNSFPRRYPLRDSLPAADVAIAKLATHGNGGAAFAGPSLTPAAAMAGADRRGSPLVIGGGVAACVFLLAMGWEWRMRKARPQPPGVSGPPERAVLAGAFAATALWFGLLVGAYVSEHDHAGEVMIAPALRSPNSDARPPGVEISSIVLHATGQTNTWNTARTFLDFTANISAHFVVGRTGEIVQTVPLERRAWHAGVSELEGVSDVNDYSIGIELVNRNDGIDPYPDVQYAATARLIDRVRALYPVPVERIVTHAAVALPAGRKSDPLGFDLERLRAILARAPISGRGS